MKKLLRNYSLTWQQIGLIKTSVFSFGLAIGAYWPEIFSPIKGLLLIIAFGLGWYVYKTIQK